MGSFNVYLFNKLVFPTVPSPIIAILIIFRSIRMALKNFKYNMLFKELVGQGLLLEELDDYTKTVLMHFKQQHSRNASNIEASIDIQLAKGNKLVEHAVNDNITREVLKTFLSKTMDIEDILQKIAQEEEKRDLLIDKFDQLVSGFEERLQSLDDQFSLENLNQELFECSTENEIKTAIDSQLKRLDDDAQYLEQIQTEIPNYDNLKIIRNNLLTNNALLQEKEKQFKVLKEALSQMKLRLKDF
ncbi:uncharacterized protein [Onthophagus taurus]|uniref:uncharacterized protein isoform X1 n=2 Tax=Onthophagus taurus TaxID=166361 RepID=UPI0039BDCA3A